MRMRAGVGEIPGLKIQTWGTLVESVKSRVRKSGTKHLGYPAWGSQQALIDGDGEGGGWRGGDGGIAGAGDGEGVAAGGSSA